MTLSDKDHCFCCVNQVVPILTRYELMMSYKKRLMTMLVSFWFFWTFQRLLAPLITKYYSHDLSVATVSRVMHWPGCALISQIGSSISEWQIIVRLGTSWPVVFHRVLCWDRFCTLCTRLRLQMSSNVTVWGIISMSMTPCRCFTVKITN